MRKLLPLLALALCLLTLCSCRADVALDDIANQLRAANSDSADADAPQADGAAEAASAADAADADSGETADETQPAEDAAIASSTDSGEEAPAALPDEEPAADLTALPLEELVTDADGAPGQLPRITASCSGAAYINDDIEGSFLYLVADPACTLYYDAYKNGDILSLVVAQNWADDRSYYTPYNLDLSTGAYLSGEDLLARLGAEATVVGDAEIGVMTEEFQHLYGDLAEGDGAPFYQEQYDRTTSTDNIELHRVWLGYGGELTFVARIFSLAGSEFYEYPMATGLYY